MRVYRAEHPGSLKGPWTHSEKAFHPNKHPLPYSGYEVRKTRWGTFLPGPTSDGIDGFHEQDQRYSCGAPSLRKLLRWFPSLYRKPMAEAGFVFRELEVPEEAVFGEGYWQVAFDRKAAAVVRELPLARIPGMRS